MPHSDELDAYGRLRLIRLSTVKPEKVRWLWKGRVPLCALTLVAGRQGSGKSTLTAELAARVTHGELAGDLRGHPSDVLLMSFEDDLQTTIVPRLMAAGADLERVETVDVEEHDDQTNALVTLPDDLTALERQAQAAHARLLIIDPVVASLPPSIDAHRDQDVRRALAPLSRLAQRCDLAVLALIHWNKGASTDALTRISGSTAFSAAARSVLAFGVPPDRDEKTPDRVVAHAKCNLAPLAASVEYRMESAVIPRLDDVIETGRIRPVGECDIGAHRLLSTGETETKLDEAVVFLRDELTDGKWREKEALLARARAERISRNTLLRAGNKIGVEFRRHGFPSKGQWRLPQSTQALWEEAESATS